MQKKVMPSLAIRETVFGGLLSQWGLLRRKGLGTQCNVWPLPGGILHSDNLPDNEVLSLIKVLEKRR